MQSQSHSQSQSIANRVSSAPDGRVQFTFAARPGTCGNGRTYIQTGPNSVTGSISYNGNFYGNYNDGMRADPCVAGPVRVVIDRADKQPLSIQAYVGPPDTTLRGVTDLGRVRAQDAADYLLSLASTVDGRAGRDALFPAMLADSANTARDARDDRQEHRRCRARRAAARCRTWAARPTACRRFRRASPIRSSPSRATRRDNQSVRQQALSVLGRLDHGSGIPSLIQLSQQTQSNWLAKESMSTLSRSGDPRARQYLRTAVRRTDLPDEVLTVALRSLGQDYATAQDAALLREVYPTLKSDRAREAVFSALADIGGSENTKWMLNMAQSGNEQLPMRRRALDAASRAGAPIAEMVRAVRHDDRSDHEGNADRDLHPERRARGGRQAAARS